MLWEYNEEAGSGNPTAPIHVPLQAKRLHDALVRKFGLSLRIPLSEYVHFEGPLSVVMPYLKPSDIFSTMMSKHPWLLLGGSTGPESQRMLASFWKCYRLDHPSHSVFEFDEDRLKRTIPITVHGDGGRTQKKQPLEIFSIQPVMGLNTQASRKRCSCHCETSVEFGGGDAGDPSTHCLNSKHNTYMTHFLVFAYPSKSYKGFNDLLTGLLEAACTDLGTLCAEGVLGLMGSGGIRLLSGLNSIWNGWQNVGRWRALIRMLAMFEKYLAAASVMLVCQTSLSRMSTKMPCGHRRDLTLFHGQWTRLGSTSPLTLRSLQNSWGEMLSTSSAWELEGTTLLLVSSCCATWNAT